MGVRFKAVAAVYFVTRRSYDNGTYRRACHEGIYIGRTEDLSACFAEGAQMERFRKFGANCVCVHALADEARRIAVEQDLLEAHSTPGNSGPRIARLFGEVGTG